MALARSGLPVQIAAERHYERRPTRAQLAAAFAAGATVYMPQIHQVLPRVARLMTALRASLFGPGREETSFLFIVDGRGRQGLGLHHDGEVESVWVQLEGRRTVTTGPPVKPGTRQDLDETVIGRGWRTQHLEPGSLFYMKPRTPHRVVCHGRSLALSLTWKLRKKPLAGSRAAAAMAAWDVAAGHAEAVPRASRDRLWTQVPVFAGPVDRQRGDFPLWLPGGVVRLPASAWPTAKRLSTMPSLSCRALPRAAQPLLALGILGARDLPLRIIPKNPRALDGWRFA